MNFLIVTEPDDIHAIYVTLALQSLGHQVINLFSADFPTLQKNTVFIDNRQYRCKSQDLSQTIEHLAYDVVWWRRPRQPYLEKEMIFFEDYKFHQRENLMFHDSFMHQVAPRAWWVNRKEASIRANYKLLQLKVAGDVGLTIPTTLCTNHFAEIKDFYQRYQKKGVIYKPLTYQFWDEGDCLKICYTAKIENLDILEKTKTGLIPGIYQEQIPKQYELRVICFGDFILSVKIDSQRHHLGKIDWRTLGPHQLEIEPYHLPENVKEKIRYLMRELGLVFGCLDLIVTPSGEYIFLEVNEQGQFLFIEQLCPELPVLDIFVNFLIQQSMDFHWVKKNNLLSMKQFQELIDKYLTDNKAKHVDVRGLHFKKKQVS
jgi:glutathione synthase/RimK-type ligase-like ATP-grasp enzyme